MLIGAYQPSQRSSLIDLLQELADFYDAPHRATAPEVAAHLDGTITAPGSPVTLVTAASPNGDVVGLAALVVMPSILQAVGPDRLQCNLKELYVTTLGRSAGVGSALLRWSARFAVERGCGRLDWHVTVSNDAGIRFYQRHGAQLVPDRLSYRLHGDALGSLAAPQPAS